MYSYIYIYIYIYQSLPDADDAKEGRNHSHYMAVKLFKITDNMHFYHIPNIL